MNPWAAVIGAVLGGVRASAEDSNNKRENRTNVTREQWSPYTGQHGKDIKNADYMGRVMQGASTGAAMGQQMGGGQAAPQANAGTAGMGMTQGAAFDGSGVTPAQANGAPGSAIDYGSPNASGYSPWRAGMVQQPAPAYVAPGQMPVDPYRGSSAGAARQMAGMNVAPVGAFNPYARR